MPTTFTPTQPASCSIVLATVADLPMVHRGTIWYGRLGYSNGGADACYAFGNAADKPITGDWDGDGDATLGVFRPSTGTWYLRNGDGGGAADPTMVFRLSF